MASTAMSMPMAEPSLQMKLPSSSQNLMPQPPNIPKGMTSSQRDRLRIDPKRALEPTRKKLSTLESQRIMAVVLDSIKKMEVISALPIVMENRERFSVAFASDIVDALERHEVIINSYKELYGSVEKYKKEQTDNELLSQKSAVSQSAVGTTSEATEKEELKEEDGEDEHETKTDREESMEVIAERPVTAQSNSPQLEAALRNLELVGSKMHHSVRDIIRLFWNNPTAQNIVLQVSEKTDGAWSMITNMVELKEIALHKLLTTPVEENERNNYLDLVSKRERHNAGIIAKLQHQLDEARTDKKQEVEKKNDVISQLMSSVQQLKKFSEEQIRRTKSEAEKQEATDAKNSEGKKVKWQQEQTQLKNQLQELINSNRNSEQTLRKRKFQVETEVENWIQRYDQEMGERQTEFEEIDKVYTEEKSQLNELEERFKTLEEEYSQIMEERRVAREKREAQEREMQMSVHAATTIQAFWRSFKVRKALKSKKKKGGKKKGKK